MPAKNHRHRASRKRFSGGRTNGGPSGHSCGRARYACAVADDVALIIQVQAGSLVDRQLQDDPPPIVTSGRAVVEAIPADAEGRIVPPEGGEVVLTLLSPESLREADQVEPKILKAASGEPPVVVLQVAEELRADELAVLLQAADRAQRTVLLCVLLGSS